MVLGKQQSGAEVIAVSLILKGTYSYESPAVLVPLEVEHSSALEDSWRVGASGRDFPLGRASYICDLFVFNKAETYHTKNIIQK